MAHVLGRLDGTYNFLVLNIHYILCLNILKVWCNFYFSYILKIMFWID